MAAPRVFVSHSHTDQAFTQRLVTDLHAAGAEVWVDAGGLTHGNFMQRIDEALAQCEWMVLVLTPNAITSEYVRDEVYSSLHRVRQGYMRDVIPILAAPCAPGTVPPQWDVLHRYDATGTTGDYGAALAGVLHAMGLAPAAGGAAPSVADPSAGAGAFGTLPAEHLPVGLVQLGFVGRVVNNVEVILPPLCDVAAGEFPMGSDPAQDGQAQANERPRHPVTLAAFRIGRSPSPSPSTPASCAPASASRRTGSSSSANSTARWSTSVGATRRTTAAGWGT